MTRTLQRKRRFRGKGSEKLYEDEDGVATLESEALYSTKVQSQLLFLFSVCGLGISLFLAVKYSIHGGGIRTTLAWLEAVLWVALFLHAVEVAIEKEPTTKFNIALANSALYLIAAATVVPIDGLYRLGHLSTDLGIAKIAIALAGFIDCVSFPRRPDVYQNGIPVDRQKTVSALERYTFSWKSLQADNLPRMDAGFRAKDLHDAFVSRDFKGRLWKSMIRAHAPKLTMQYIADSVESVAIVAPQFAMYQLLRLLEERDRGEEITYAASMWTIGLELRWWIGYSLNVSVRIQLNALIFTKSMRRKDVKGIQKNLPQEEESNKANGTGKDDQKITKTEAPTAQKTKQGTINLVGVDSKRVGDFYTWNVMLYGTVIKLTVSFFFIYKLVGWQALLAGLAAQLATVPLNVYVSTKYTKAQNSLMSARDAKLAILNEALSGIRQIKFSALEQQWQAKIREYRETELKSIWGVFMADTFLLFCWIFGPYMLSAVTLAVHAVIYGHLYPSTAFTTIGILGNIEGSLAFIPELITHGVDAWVSLKRIEEYLQAPEKPQNTVPGNSVSFRNATVAWPSDNEPDDESFALRELTIDFPDGELSVISGKTGSGKSLLLAAILGEVEVLSGTVEVPQAPPLKERYDWKANKSNWIIPSAIAFVSQQPWIENCTFKENVLFGLPLDESRYKRVISACALTKDLEMFTDGDTTEIGAQGINLSGGQRWRITLARALYSRAGILVMDDIFSAVDAHVGRHIFEQALVGELSQGRTRIIVTHHVSLCLPKTKYEVLLHEGRVDRAGFVDDLRQTGALDEILKEENDEVLEDDEELLPLPTESNGNASHRSELIDDGHIDANKKAPPKQFMEVETKQKGRISFSIYLDYFRAGGGVWAWGGILIFFVVIQALIIGRSWWVTIWSGQYKEADSTNTPLFSSFQHPMVSKTHLWSSAKTNMEYDTKFYVTIYVAISASIAILGALRYFTVYCGSIKASRTLFDNLAFVVLRAPLRWFDTVPTGRILNRFTSDFNAIDMELANGFSFALYSALMTIGIIIAVMTVTPWMIIFAVILLVLCLRYAVFYLIGARETRRLESLAKSPIFDLFGTTLSGIATIRAFDKSSSYIDSMYAKLDNHGRTLFYLWITARWLSWRLAVVGAAFSTAMAALVVSIKAIDAALAGFALGFTLNYASAVVWTLRQYTSVELSMNAVERIVEYTRIDTETQDGIDAPAAWPAEGRLEVSNLVVSYAADLEPVLKGLTFSIKPNERIGVVGRTGAGKSSLTLALFRFLEARQGSIVIDGLDVSKIKLHDLRSRVAIIPQDPVLFSGTVRSNIDPFNEREDYELREALERVHLVSSSPAESSAANADDNTNPFTSLLTPISEGGQNLSQGQRQLLCLARAIIARPKIMILDEATSAVDKGTDELIQRSIREEFGGSTLLVIAHRLSTIVDFDRILVMGEGRVVEYDSPRTLLEKEGGVFRGMVEDSGERELLESIILGTEGE
ncbi:P-loop containing nucleoside triphosphate hydrolase protein [Saccharata proteae CBS 121410]|uniref:P-loop containing nucleoside triphosphate hydrolase protein n=1 Tax=Saccharata proteae CBS 121410 TaxID=1314787 RepID=A0A6A5YCD6_9PEZI|nr:P-loop containing nucleoside triphosphate hydrolase protein [Saccharata proteae CBS 121410]